MKTTREINTGVMLKRRIMSEKIEYRVEKDSIGSKDVPEDVYYGVPVPACRRESSILPD